MTLVFDDKERTFLGWARNNESTYLWLNRSAQPEAAMARARIERLYADFPDSSGRLLRSLRHPDGRHAGAAYRGALASLLMHHKLVDLGFSVTTDEDTHGDNARPDLIAVRQDVGRIVVEVTVLGSKQAFDDHDWRTGRLVDAINDKLTSPCYTLAVHVHGELPDEFDASPVVEAIGDELVSLGDPGPDASSAGPWPNLNVRLHNAEVDIDFIALSPARRSEVEESGHRIIDIYPGGGGCPNTEGRLRRKLHEKHPRRYPAQVVTGDTPYVVAIGLCDVFASSRACRDSLWGDEAIALHLDQPDRATPFRKNNGFFGVGPNGPKNADVSGVFFMHRFSAEIWHKGTLSFEYFENPYASCALRPEVLAPDRVFGVVASSDDRLELGWLDEAKGDS
ncbi:MAG: hypothetical protein WC971_08140 [Coriobacteriia bacterium]